MELYTVQETEYFPVTNHSLSAILRTDIVNNRETRVTMNSCPDRNLNTLNNRKQLNQTKRMQRVLCFTFKTLRKPYLRDFRFSQRSGRRLNFCWVSFSQSFVVFWFHFFCHCMCGCMFCILLFNFINCVFLSLYLCILIIMFTYSYCYVCSLLYILFPCVVLCIVCM